MTRLEAGDLDGLMALYEPDAVMMAPDGRTVLGYAEIRDMFARVLEANDSFPPGEPRVTLRVGDIALTSTRLEPGSTTAEVARRQPDGSWLWVLDDPDVGRDA